MRLRRHYRARAAADGDESAVTHILHAVRFICLMMSANALRLRYVITVFVVDEYATLLRLRRAAVC